MEHVKLLLLLPQAVRQAVCVNLIVAQTNIPMGGHARSTIFNVVNFANFYDLLIQVTNSRSMKLPSEA